MIVKDPCFRVDLHFYFLRCSFDSVLVRAESLKRAKEMMVEHTSKKEWAISKGTEIVITEEEQIVLEM